MKNAYAKNQAELRRQLLNYGALVGQQFNVDMMCLALNEEDFVPREERYPNVKVPGMGKKFKAEPIGG